MEIGLILGVVVLLAVLACYFFGKPQSKWVSTDAFEAWKKEVSYKCN